MIKGGSPSILSLATETFHDIGLKLDSRDVQSLRATCKQLDAAVKPLALSRLIINMNKANVDYTIVQLQAYATNATSATPYVRTLELRCLSPSRDINSPQASVITNSDGAWTYANPSFDPKVIDAEHTLEECLCVLLPLLKQVRCIRWTLSAPDPQRVHPLIVDYILSLPFLEDLSLLFVHGLSNPLSFARAPSVRSLTISGIFMARHPKPIIQLITDIIANSPELTELELHSGVYSAEVDSDAPTLHQLIENVPQDTPLRIQHLSLTCWRTLLDVQTLPHLRHLKSLHVDHNLHTPAFGSSLTNIWSSLQKENIHLAEIQLNLVDVENGLIDYLASYSGLERLILTNYEYRWNDTNEVYPIAERFFALALLPHAESLRILHLRPYPDSAWCFDRCSALPISQCRWLKELCIVIRPQSLYDGETRKLIENVSTSLVHLERLSICCPGPSQEIDIRHSGSEDKA